ncbi:bifunctional (p)ppGpp synthetase/guanosine-3',5'-bis(diphosphate) 3'-pyrophosphohydrolase [bacterium]|nr:MAG: bifunctional (p)ppGpp synthetase/guanosine-3',5'-bis(diphosphate) 3'-pyrophosphohydrolase [bacterium]
MRYPKVQEAIEFAAAKHRGTDRDGDDPLPYIVHPIEVLSFARLLGGITDEDLLTAAALHDTIEDTETTYEEIAVRFGSAVADHVQGLTREEPTEAQREGKSKDEIWMMRSEMLLAEIGRMPAAVLPIKLADRLSNVREGKKTKKGAKIERYLGQTRQILKIVPRGVNPALWDAIQAELPDLP